MKLFFFIKRNSFGFASTLELEKVERPKNMRTRGTNYLVEAIRVSRIDR